MKNSYDDVINKVRIDYESGSVFINASSKRAEEILKVAIVINELTVEPYRRQLDVEYLENVKELLTTWKRPKPQKWKVGDVFSIPLSDGTFAFGQVVWERDQAPNCALFDCKAKSIPAIEDVISSIIISVLSIGSERLDSFQWHVIGNAPVRIEPQQVPAKHRGDDVVGSVYYSSSFLSNLAEAYYGLIPWISLPQNSHDELLLPSVKRPLNAVIEDPKNE